MTVEGVYADGSKVYLTNSTQTSYGSGRGAISDHRPYRDRSFRNQWSDSPGQSASGAVYQDDRIRLIVPNDWTAKQATLTATGDRTIVFPIGVVLSKGPFLMYLLTHYPQVSGVVGGRFGEISRYVAPWMKVSDPWGCFDVFKKTVTPVTHRLSRVDLFLGVHPFSKPADPDCGSLGRGLRAPVWSGSYFGSRTGTGAVPGFFLDFPLATNGAVSIPQMVFAATMATNSPHSLPAATSVPLQHFLREASEIVRNIQYK